jgi:hypothetical protein
MAYTCLRMAPRNLSAGLHEHMNYHVSMHVTTINDAAIAFHAIKCRQWVFCLLVEIAHTCSPWGRCILNNISYK